MLSTQLTMCGHMMGLMPLCKIIITRVAVLHYSRISICFGCSYGLAPNYGCCTSNFNQGWPKFTQHLVMEHGSGLGLVVAMYSPAVVKHTLANGAEAELSIKTDYPFDGIVTIDASCEKGMILSLRIPSWAYQSNISINGTKQDKSPFPGEYNAKIDNE